MSIGVRASADRLQKASRCPLMAQSRHEPDAHVRWWGESGHDRLRMSAFVVAIGAKRHALLRRICLLLTQSGHLLIGQPPSAHVLCVALGRCRLRRTCPNLVQADLFERCRLKPAMCDSEQLLNLRLCLVL
jgi:hypothetical protein